VDPAVAVQMAVGVRRLLGSDFAVATTGSAGPDPDPGGPMTGPVPPGRGFVAVVGPGVDMVTGFACEGQDRAGVRRHAVMAALALLGRALAETDANGRLSAGPGTVEA
jgi:nicotinamide-nucleotide amidase